MSLDHLLNGDNSLLLRVAEGLDPTPHPYVEAPAEWIEDELGEFVWSKQADVLNSVCDNRYTAVRSCHGVGKSWVAARAVAWWLAVHPVGEAFVVTTAPTAPQVEAILWREISRAHRKGDLPGYTTGGPIPSWKINGELVAYGRKPADYDQAAFQGIHARYVLVVLDEAGGVPKSLYDAVDSLVTNELSRVLAIGNPDDPSSHFENVCRPASGWNVIGISAFDAPCYTGEYVPEDLVDVLISKLWVEERKARWGKDSPLYIAKVLGQFPEISDDMLITPALLRRAYINDLSERELQPGRYGADIARLGKDRTVVYRNRGGVVRLEDSWGKLDTMKTAGKLKLIVDARLGEVPIVIDIIGVGAGPYDRLKEQGVRVLGFNSAEKANRPDRFVNRRAEQWWEFKVLLEDSELDLEEADEDLAAELLQIKWGVTSSGRIFIEKKDETRKRLPDGRSPDNADAAMMSTWVGGDWMKALKVDSSSASNPDHKRKRAKSLTADLMEAPL